MENVKGDVLKKELYEYHRLNKSFRCMAIAPVKLKIMNSIEPPKPKFYTVPMKYVSRAKEEFDRLVLRYH